MAKEHLGMLFAGLAAGDSLGSTSEFTSREEVLSLYKKHSGDGWPFSHVGGGYFNWRPGQPTDDTETAVRMVRSFIEHGSFNPDDLADRLVKWHKTDPGDVGTTTILGLGHIAEGAPWYEGGLRDFKRRPMNASNGSLLRNGIVPGMADSLDEAFRISLYHGIMTHYAPRPVLCCAAQTYLIWEFLEGHNPFKSGWVHKKSWPKKFREIWTKWFEKSQDDEYIAGWGKNVESELPKAWKALLETDFDPESFNPYVYSPKGGAGYVLTSLQLAVWATHWSLKREVFRVPEGYPGEVFEKRGQWVLGWLAMTGGDTDSYGSTAGPMIAAAHGSLPSEMTDGLEILDGFQDLLS